MRPMLLMPLAILAAVGCTRPEVEAFQKAPAPIVVSFKSLADGGDGPEVEKEYAAALRARLANRTWVVPEGVAAPATAVELRVQVSQVQRGDRPPKGVEAGIITGVAVGTLSALAGDRNAFWRGLHWGLWTGVHVSAHERRDHRWTIVPPNRIRGFASLHQPGVAEPLATFEIDPSEVLDAMDSLRPSEQEDRVRVREEEAKAFARVLVARIADHFEWPLTREARWYQAPAAPQP